MLAAYSTRRSLTYEPASELTWVGRRWLPGVVRRCRSAPPPNPQQVGCKTAPVVPNKNSLAAETRLAVQNYNAPVPNDLSRAALQGLVAVLRGGSEKGMQKAAAAVANMAWHSEALRATLCKVVGLLEALERPLKVSL